MRMGLLIWGCVLFSAFALGYAAPSGASEQRPTVDEVSREVMCPTCGRPLEQSTGAAADRMRAYIAERIEDGWTKSQIVDGLVAEYGNDQSIRVVPEKRGSGLVAWLVPVVVFVLALFIGLAVTLRWRRRAREAGAPAT